MRRYSGKIAASEGSSTDPAAARPKRAAAVLLRAAKVGGIGAVVLGVSTIACLAYFATTLPPMSLVRETPQPSLILEAKNGDIFGYRGIFDGPPADVAEMPDRLVQAVIAIEDRRFYDHFGIDPRAIARAALKNIMHWQVREGGSTITQQLAKIEYLTPDRSLARKVQEALIAIRLERHLKKNEILQSYLNKVYFGAGAYGVTAAAQRYFGKAVSDLSLPEAAMLAGLVRSPSRLAPTRNIEGARARARLVLKAMQEASFITPGERDRAGIQLATLTPTVPDASGESFFADWVQGETRRALGPTFGDFTVRTTLDPRLQALAERIVEERMSSDGQALDAKQAALVAMAPDGAVLAMVGGRDYRASQFNRVTQGRRQPGSLFKLFVYQTALENGFTTNTVLVDRPVKIGDWAPKNYTARFRGPITLETAFAKSTNTIAAQLVEKLGPKAIADTARRMGIRSRLDPKPSLALGTSETTLLEITGSYASVLRGTIGVDPYGIQEIRSGDATLYNRSFQPSDKARPLPFRDDVLRLLRAAVQTGTGRRARLDGEVAGKTGTSQDHKDAWFVGFTPEIVVGVWVGNDDGAPTKGITGGKLPAEIWRDFVRAAQDLIRLPAPAPIMAQHLPEAAPTQIASSAPVAITAPEISEAPAAIPSAPLLPQPESILEDPPPETASTGESMTDTLEAEPVEAAPSVDTAVTPAEPASEISTDVPPTISLVPPPAPRPRFVAVAVVPDLAELSTREAARVLGERRLGYRIAGTVTSPLQRGTVAGQDPPPGRRVALHSRVSVWTAQPVPPPSARKAQREAELEPSASPAPPPPKTKTVSLVPDLASLRFEEAAALLKARGLRFRNAGTTGPNRAAGAVIRQTPRAGQRVPRGTQVAIWTARPDIAKAANAEPPAVRRNVKPPAPRVSRVALVPKLTETGLDDAVARLKRAGLRVREAGTVESGLPPGTVARQDPGAGQRVPRNTVVAVWAARAPLIEVPDLGKRTAAQAIALLKQRGLRYRAAGTVESKGEPGRVARQRPAAGKRVAAATVVSVWATRRLLVEVPDLTGRTPTAAAPLLAGRGLRVRIEGQVDSERRAGTIARQDPAPGRKISPETVVSVWSARPALVEVPNLAGMTEVQARQVLKRRKLEYRAAGTVESGQSEDTIARQTPKSGQRVPPGTQVAVLMATPVRVIVPDVAEMIPIEARAVLRRSGLRYRLAGTVESPLPKGWIAKQSPNRGRRVAKDSVVSVWVAAEPMVKVPNVAAMTQEAAAALLRQRGLSHRRAGAVESDLPSGTVAKQEPGAGQRARRDSVVTIWTARPRLVVGVPRVESTSTLWFGGRRVRLAGVLGFTGRYAMSMASYIQGRRVKCRPTAGRAHRCEIGGYDLAEVVIYNGGGRATANAPRKLRAAEAQARRARKGIWAASRRPAL